MKKRRGMKGVTIVGIVQDIEEEWDAEEVTILTEDGKNYMVAMNRQGKKLLNKIGKKVEATGRITKNKDGIVRISISGFEVFKPEDDYIEDSDYDMLYNYEDEY